MAGIATNFVAELKEELEFKKAEKEQISDQLKLYDVRIDRYDAVIENMDKSVLPLIDEINASIDAVKSAYDARIAADCRSDLVWTQTSTYQVRVSGRGNQFITKTIYEAKKDPAVRIQSNRYGVKYYRRPKNQDYGSNIVAEFFGTIGAGSTLLAIVNTGIAGTAGILPGDTITDDLETPITFGVDDLPDIVGYGISTLVIDTTEFNGQTSVGSTIIAQVGIGSTSEIQIGASIENIGFLAPNTTVVGIGTTVIQVTDFNPDTGEFEPLDTDVPTLILSAGAIGIGTTTFTVGITSDYMAFTLSTTADQPANNTNFTVIRTTQSVVEEFDPTNNPIDPVTVAIMNNQRIGLGHTAILVNNGSPAGPFQWREVLGEYDPEPACGNGNRVYYSGDYSWPAKQVSIYSTTFPWTGLSTSIFAVSEGETVTVTTGSTFPATPNITTLSVSPTNPSYSGCSALDAAITSAEAARDALIAKHAPVINSTLAGAASLRTLRDKLEGIAFTFLQGRANADADINKLTRQIKELEALDLSKFEPTKNITKNKFSSDTTGQATS